MTGRNTVLCLRFAGYIVRVAGLMKCAMSGVFGGMSSVVGVLGMVSGTGCVVVGVLDGR